MRRSASCSLQIFSIGKQKNISNSNKRGTVFDEPT